MAYRRTVAATAIPGGDSRLIHRLAAADQPYDSETLIEFILEADPSRAKAKFGRWILSLIQRDQVRVPEDAPVVRALLERILELRRQNKLHLLRREIGHTDLNRPNSFQYRFLVGIQG